MWARLGITHWENLDGMLSNLGGTTKFIAVVGILVGYKFEYHKHSSANVDNLLEKDSKQAY